MLEVAHKAYATVYSPLVCRHLSIHQVATHKKHRILPEKACTWLSRCKAKLMGNGSEVYHPIWCQIDAANLFDKLLVFGVARRTVSGRVDGHYGYVKKSAYGFMEECRAKKQMQLLQA